MNLQSRPLDLDGCSELEPALESERKSACNTSQGVEALRLRTLDTLHELSTACITTRRPLVRKSDKATAVKLYNPRFEEDFALGKDFDPDRCAILQFEHYIYISRCVQF